MTVDLVFTTCRFQTPYSECESVGELYKLVTSHVPPQGLACIENENARRFVELCISPNPADRPTAEELSQHPFLKVRVVACVLQSSTHIALCICCVELNATRFVVLVPCRRTRRRTGWRCCCVAGLPGRTWTVRRASLSCGVTRGGAIRRWTLCPRGGHA